MSSDLRKPTLQAAATLVVLICPWTIPVAPIEWLMGTLWLSHAAIPVPPVGMALVYRGRANMISVC